MQPAPRPCARRLRTRTSLARDSQCGRPPGLVSAHDGRRVPPYWLVVNTGLCLDRSSARLPHPTGVHRARDPFPSIEPARRTEIRVRAGLTPPQTGPIGTAARVPAGRPRGRSAPARALVLHSRLSRRPCRARAGRGNARGLRRTRGLARARGRAGQQRDLRHGGALLLLLVHSPPVGAALARSTGNRLGGAAGMATQAARPPALHADAVLRNPGARGSGADHPRVDRRAQGPRRDSSRVHRQAVPGAACRRAAARIHLRGAGRPVSPAARPRYPVQHAQPPRRRSGRIPEAPTGALTRHVLDRTGPSRHPGASRETPRGSAAARHGPQPDGRSDARSRLFRARRSE